MKFLKLIPIFFIFSGIIPNSSLINAESKQTNNFKVLSEDNKQLSISTVKSYLEKGDNFIESGNFKKAKETYDEARNIAKQIAGFYRDLKVSFKGIDARVPLEMDKKGRESIKIWAESNSRLAALYLRQKDPAVAVPLLVEIIRLMTPNSPEGKEAYKSLMQLGFVETSYKGF